MSKEDIDFDESYVNTYNRGVAKGFEKFQNENEKLHKEYDNLKKAFDELTQKSGEWITKLEQERDEQQKYAMKFQREADDLREAAEKLAGALEVIITISDRAHNDWDQAKKALVKYRQVSKG